MSRSRTVAVLLVASLAAAALPTHRAKAEVVERVVAVVNDDAIFLSDLRRRAAPFLPRVMAAPSEMQRMGRLTQLYQQLLDQLVDEALFQQAARRLQVRVTAEDVDRAISNVQRASGLSEEDFWSAVREQGFTEPQYRQDVRRQLVRLRVINQRVRGRVSITEHDVHQRYDELVRQARGALRFRAAHVFLPVTEGASAADVAAVRAHAAEIRRGLTAETFPAAMSEYGGGELGELRQEDLPEALAAALVAMEPGQISEPVRGPAGFHVLLLESRQASEQAVPAYEQARGDLHRQLLEAAMGRQEQQFLQELRRDAVVQRRL